MTDPKTEQRTPTRQPAWVAAGRLQLGEREIPGERHNSKIVSWFKGWFRDDETPWCGAFVNGCMETVGIQGPKIFVRASEWATWGQPCRAQIGAVGVKLRKGGGHVFIIIGQTADGLFYKALGGNQGNRVSIVDIRKSETIAVRWPAGVPVGNFDLPVLAPGTVGASEA